MADFDQYAGTYDRLLDQSLALSGETSQYFAEYKARYIAAAMAPSRSQKILDFGCGVGLLSAALKTARPDVTLHGYDVSSESLAKIDSALLQSGRFTAELTCLDSDYDAIVMASVLHHVPINQRTDIMVELANRLAGDGKLIVFEHNPLNPVTRWVVRQCPFDHDAILLMPGEVITRLRDAGLRDNKCDYIVFFPKFFSSCRPLERFLGWCPLGAQYVITAAKNPADHIDENLHTASGVRR